VKRSDLTRDPEQRRKPPEHARSDEPEQRFLGTVFAPRSYIDFD
jgi:hypothetical protein